MGKVTQRSTEQEQAPKPRRKRRKKDLDRIHSKILRAKRKLDDVGKGDNEAGQKKRNQAKICNRLLPEPAAGIYRNGAKGKDIQKAETVENTFHKARLKADALKLFNGDTHGSKCIVEIPIHDITTKQSPNKDCMKSSLEWTPYMLEQSPVLGKKPRQNQKPCLIKKKGEENIYSNKIKQNVNEESRHSQKENICKRRLFQNDREQLETITNISTTKIFDDFDLTKKNKVREKETEQICSKNSMDSSCAPLNRYMEFCKIISAENFEVDILQNYHSDPVTTTIKKLRHAYADSFHRQLLRQKNKQELENVKPTYSADHQTYTSSDILQLSPVEFEVPKCSENHTIAVPLQEGSSSQRNDKFHLTQNAEFKKCDDITYNNSTSCSSRNTFSIYNTNDPIVDNCENNDTQHSKQSKDIRQLSKSMNFYFMNDKDSIPLDSQKNSSYVNHLSKNKQHDKVNFSIKIPGCKKPCIDNSIHLGTMFLKNSVFSKRHFSKDYFREKLPIAVSDNYVSNNVSQKCNNRTANNCNVKNVKRVPTILRRYSNIANNKLDPSVEITDNYAEGLHKKSEINLFNRNTNNSIDKEVYETAFPNGLKNLSTSNTSTIFEQTKILEPQIGSMKIKDSQESQIEQFNINMHPKEHNEKNRFYSRYNGSLHPQTFETSSITNAYSKNLPQQEQISPDMRKHLFHSNNYRPINYLQGVNFSNSNLEPTKEFPQRTKLHICETSKQSLFRKNTCNQHQNIHFNNINDRAMPNISQNIQIEKKSTESYRKLFDKTDVECAKNQINQNARHCNEQYIYFDSANCPRKSKEQAHYFKETSQPKNLCDTRGYNDNIDNYVDVSSTMRNVPLLSLKKKNVYMKAIDDQHQAVLLQNVTQPIKYLAVKSGSDIQRIPVYINDRNVRITENIPLKVIALMDPSSQTKAFPQEIATQAIPLKTDSLHFNDLATRKISDQSFVKHLNSVNAILFNPDSQSNIWYASNL